MTRIIALLSICLILASCAGEKKTTPTKTKRTSTTKTTQQDRTNSAKQPKTAEAKAKKVDKSNQSQTEDIDPARIAEKGKKIGDTMCSCERKEVKLQKQCKDRSLKRFNNMKGVISKNHQKPWNPSLRPTRLRLPPVSSRKASCGCVLTLSVCCVHSRRNGYS